MKRKRKLQQNVLDLKFSFHAHVTNLCLSTKVSQLHKILQTESVSTKTPENPDFWQVHTLLSPSHPPREGCGELQENDAKISVQIRNETLKFLKNLQFSCNFCNFCMQFIAI